MDGPRTGPMVDRDDLVALVPHYLAMLGLAILTLFVLDVVVGDDLNFWIETAVVVVVLVAYKPVVVRLGYAPPLWERGREGRRGGEDR